VSGLVGLGVRVVCVLSGEEAGEEVGCACIVGGIVGCDVLCYICLYMVCACVYYVHIT
jgi:hypothetical protein